MSETSIANLLAHFSATESSVEVINPATGKRIFDLPQLSASQVELAFANTRAAQSSWQNTPVVERAKALKSLHRLMLENESKLMDLLQLETGKSRAHAFEEFFGATAGASYYAKIAPKALGRRGTKPGAPIITKTFVDQVALGVVGVITPWNYPLALTMLDVLPALVAGNAVVQKADNQTALTVLFARQLAVEAGIPASIWQVVVGDGETVGNAITDHADYVAFTGSTATGRKVAARAATRLIGCSLELGGKNPMIVLPSANVAQAAELALAGAFGSAGQLCVSIERVYVPSAMKAQFLEELAAKVASLTLGRSNDFSIDVGSLGGANQLKRMTDFVDDAVSSGAKLVSGGKALPELGPNFYAPTVFTDVTSTARLYRQEVFGPLIDVEGYDSVDEAIDMANDTEFGLNASVVGDERAAILVAEKLNAGSVNINEAFRATFASMASPMGGSKASGQGRRNGIGGLLRFTETKTIGLARGPIKLPSRAKQYKTMAPLMRLMAKLLK